MYNNNVIYDSSTLHYTYISYRKFMAWSERNHHWYKVHLEESTWNLHSSQFSNGLNCFTHLDMKLVSPMSSVRLVALQHQRCQDLSRILSSMGLGHQNKVSAGPLILDIHLQDMCTSPDVRLTVWTLVQRCSKYPGKDNTMRYKGSR